MLKVRSRQLRGKVCAEDDDDDDDDDDDVVVVVVVALLLLLLLMWCVAEDIQHSMTQHTVVNCVAR